MSITSYLLYHFTWKYFRKFKQITMNILYSDDILPRGQYQGQQISEVISNDPHYIKQQAKQFCFSDEVVKQAGNQPLKEYKPRR